MKKHNEGYVLIYVTVVLILFSLIGSMILTSAMKNLNAQQAAITQMQDKYAAQGMIERVVSMRDTYIFEEGQNVYRKVNDNKVEDVAVKCEKRTSENVVTLSATYGTITITCNVNLNDGTYEPPYTIGAAQPEPTETEVPTE